jgi:hypothetical protein
MSPQLFTSLMVLAALANGCASADADQIEARIKETSVRQIVSDGAPLPDAVAALQSIGYSCLTSSTAGTACTRPVSSFDPKLGCEERVALQTGTRPTFGTVQCVPAL